jgi:hypothetical protein
MVDPPGVPTTINNFPFFYYGGVIELSIFTRSDTISFGSSKTI